MALGKRWGHKYQQKRVNVRIYITCYNSIFERLPDMSNFLGKCELYKKRSQNEVEN